MVMPLCSDGVNDMFTESKVHLQKYQYAIYHMKSPEVLKNMQKERLLHHILD